MTPPSKKMLQSKLKHRRRTWSSCFHWNADGNICFWIMLVPIWGKGKMSPASKFNSNSSKNSPLKNPCYFLAASLAAIALYYSAFKSDSILQDFFRAKINGKLTCFQAPPCLRRLLPPWRASTTGWWCKAEEEEEGWTWWRCTSTGGARRWDGENTWFSSHFKKYA